MTDVKRVASGAKWALSAQLIVSVGQFAISAVTARIFSPSDFGGFAAALSLVGLLTLLTTTGLPSYLLKENGLASNHIRAIRYMALAIGAITGIFFFAVAPYWFTLLRAPEGNQFVVLLMIAQVLGPIGSVESALLRREGRLKRDAVTVILSFALPNAIGLCLALWLRQPWVLGVSFACSPIVLAISARGQQQALYSSSQPLDKGALFTFGRKITVQNLGFMLLTQVPGWIVTSSLGAGALGQFSKAISLAQMPAVALTAVQSRIVQPRWRHLTNTAQFQAAVSDGVILSAGIAFPAFGVLAANGSVVIGLWLGPGWDVAGSMVSVLAIGCAFTIPFTLVAGSFEMRGKFGPARAAQWCMVGAMMPPLTALVLTKEVIWASLTMVISQCAAFVCLIAVIRWQNSRSVRQLAGGIIQQMAWAAFISLGGYMSGGVAATFVGPGVVGELGRLLVAMLTSALLWILTSRWHAVSRVLAQRGFQLPPFLRAATGS